MGWQIQGENIIYPKDAHAPERPLPNPYLPHVAGRFYYATTCSAQTGANTLVATADLLYANPIMIPKIKTYTEIGIQVTTLVAESTARLGIYRDVGGVPATLILDAGTVLTDSIGYKSITISQSLSRGWHWLAVVFSAAPTVRSLDDTEAFTWVGLDANSEIEHHIGVHKAHAYAALPSPYGGGIVLTDGNHPRILIMV